MSYRLDWDPEALADLEALTGRAPVQAAAVVAAAEWLARVGMSVGLRAPRPGARDMRYWPVPPQGIYYFVRDGYLIVAGVEDSRRRLSPWP